MGETSPTARGARDFFCGYTARAGCTHPARRSGAVVRGGSWNNTEINARCAYRNRNQPDNRNDNLGFRVLLRAAHVLPPLLLAHSSGCVRRMGRRAGTSVPAAFRQCGPSRMIGFDQRGEGRRTAPGRSGPRACHRARRHRGHRLRRAHIKARARPGRQARRCPPPPSLPAGPPRRTGPPAACARVVLIQPPNSRPISATSPLACWY